MEKSIVLYERGNKFEKAYIQTLAGIAGALFLSRKIQPLLW